MVGSAVAYNDLPLIWEMVVLRDQGIATNWTAAATKLWKKKLIPKKRIQSLRKKAAALERAGELPTSPPMPEGVKQGLDAMYQSFGRRYDQATHDANRHAERVRELGLDPDDENLETQAHGIAIRLSDIASKVDQPEEIQIQALVLLGVPRSEVDRLYKEWKSEQAVLRAQFEAVKDLLEARREKGRLEPYRESGKSRGRGW